MQLVRGHEKQRRYVKVFLALARPLPTKHIQP
jgi:hypothetical protein